MITNRRGPGRRMCITLLSILCMAGMSQHALAAVYGRGGYSHCGYQACQQPATTRVTTPVGLDVSINLQNGQVISRNGYTITVTPLNGQGTSFAKVDFYINDSPARTAIPDETGTVRWAWKPGSDAQVTLKIVITDKQGRTVAKEFSLTIQAATTSAVSRAAPGASAPKSGISGTIQQAYNGVKQAIQALPPPVVYSFPYFLFVLLGANVLVLLLQAKRELREYHTLRALLIRVQAVNEAKQTLTQLMSHYLRTPLTVIMGGIDLLQREPDKAIAGRLQAMAQRIQTKIDGLIAQTQAAPPVIMVSGMAPAMQTARLWQRPGFFSPLLLIALIVVPFNYLVAHAGNFSLNQINLLVQVSIFAILALVSYQVFRRLQLRKRDARGLQYLVDVVHADSQARDHLITLTVDTLNEEMQAINVLSSPLPASQATTFIRDGEQRLHAVLRKFAVAKRLRGGHASNPPKGTTLQAIVAEAVKPLTTIANERSISLQIQDTPLLSPSPELISTVLRSLLDNAIAYSPEQGGKIEIAAQPQADHTVITVTDHGAGIPASKLPLLLQPFSKAEGALTFTHEGMGFSLYLDKVIMTYLGGSIMLDSTPAQGTTVTLRLPKSKVD